MATAGYSIAPGEVHVWRLDLDGAAPPLAELPAADRERADALPSGERRDRWVAARWGLLRLLGRYTGRAPGELPRVIGEFGKPALADPDAELRFSLSHSDAAALVALATGTEVGVDLERIADRGDFVALAERGIGRQAAAALRRTPPDERPRTFYAEWVRREAVAKCVGVGLARPLPDATVRTADLDLGTEWAAAVALASPEFPQVRLFQPRR